MRIAAQKRWVNGFKVGVGGLVAAWVCVCERGGGEREREREIGHVLYADDTIICCEPAAKQIRYIRVIMTLFEAVSRLNVNWGKHNLLPMNEVPQIRPLAGILRCSVEKMPTTYLGMLWIAVTKPGKYGMASWRRLKGSYLDGRLNMFL